MVYQSDDGGLSFHSHERNKFPKSNNHHVTLPTHGLGHSTNPNHLTSNQYT